MTVIGDDFNLYDPSRQLSTKATLRLEIMGSTQNPFSGFECESLPFHSRRFHLYIHLSQFPFGLDETLDY